MSLLEQISDIYLYVEIKDFPKKSIWVRLSLYLRRGIEKVRNQKIVRIYRVKISNWYHKKEKELILRII